MSFDLSTVRQGRRALQLCVLYGIYRRDKDAATASYATGMEAFHLYAATDDKAYIYVIRISCCISILLAVSFKCKVEEFAADLTFLTSQTYMI
jgi:hypothetical protein